MSDELVLLFRPLQAILSLLFGQAAPAPGKAGTCKVFMLNNVRPLTVKLLNGLRGHKMRQKLKKRQPCFFDNHGTGAKVQQACFSFFGFFCLPSAPAYSAAWMTKREEHASSCSTSPRLENIL